MNTRKLTEDILDILDKYEFITSQPFDSEKFKDEIENQIIKEYESEHHNNYDTIS
jgi:hypothetical protein